MRVVPCGCRPLTEPFETFCGRPSVDLVGRRRAGPFSFFVQMSSLKTKSIMRIQLAFERRKNERVMFELCSVMTWVTRRVHAQVLRTRPPRLEGVFYLGNLRVATLGARVTCLLVSSEFPRYVSNTFLRGSLKDT